MKTFIPKELYGVIGHPLGQSLSPLAHNSGFQLLDLPAVYLAWPVPAADLEQFVQGLRLLKIRGLSVTIPHKISIIPFLDNISEGASLAGAVNTLFWRDGLLSGDNTDIAGFLAPLDKVDLDKLDILLLGAGGAAHAAAAALKLRGCARVRVASKSNKRQYPLAERFGFYPIPWEERYNKPASLVINSTPLGMTGKAVRESPYDFAIAPETPGGWAYDLVYNPLRTKFLEEASQAGRHCISGIDMFYGQANAQFKIWTGREFPPEVYDILKKALIS